MKNAFVLQQVPKAARAAGWWQGAEAAASGAATSRGQWRSGHKEAADGREGKVGAAAP